MDITSKKGKLQKFLSSKENIGVAYSGGIDSTLILQYAFKNTQNVKAFIVKTFFTSKTDYNDAVNFCSERNMDYRIIEPLYENFEPVLKSPVDRCYRCKKIIFSNIINIAASEGYNTIIDGSNSSDNSDYRPGKKALKELGIISPFVKIGINKNEIRYLAKEEGIHFFDKPSNSCLLTRIPYEREVTLKKIEMIEKGEEYLKSMGFKVVRLRHFDEIALIEVGWDERDKLFKLKILDQIKNYMSEIGFDYTAIEAGGYKTGNLNKLIEETKTYG